MNGRPPKPRKLKAIHGTQRPDRARDEGQGLRAARPDPPEWLTDDVALEEWDLVVGELAAANYLTLIDRSIVASYCEAVATYAWAIGDIAENGWTFVKTDNGYEQQRPSVSIMKQARSDIRQLAPLLGITASGRAKLSPVEPARKPKSHWDVVA